MQVRTFLASLHVQRACPMTCAAAALIIFFLFIRYLSIYMLYCFIYSSNHEQQSRAFCTCVLIVQRGIRNLTEIETVKYARLHSRPCYLIIQVTEVTIKRKEKNKPEVSILFSTGRTVQIWSLPDFEPWSSGDYFQLPDFNKEFLGRCRHLLIDLAYHRTIIWNLSLIWSKLLSQTARRCKVLRSCSCSCKGSQTYWSYWMYAVCLVHELEARK